MVFLLIGRFGLLCALLRTRLRILSLGTLRRTLCDSRFGVSMVLFVSSTFATVCVCRSGKTQETASDNRQFNKFHPSPSFVRGCGHNFSVRSTPLRTYSTI